jgi:hypothetical protein
LSTMCSRLPCVKAYREEHGRRWDLHQETAGGGQESAHRRLGACLATFALVNRDLTYFRRLANGFSAGYG